MATDYRRMWQWAAVAGALVGLWMLWVCFVELRRIYEVIGEISIEQKRTGDFIADAVARIDERDRLYRPTGKEAEEKALLASLPQRPPRGW